MKKILVVLNLLVVTQAQAFFPINIFQPYDLNTFRPTRWYNTKYEIDVTGEFGLKTNAWTACELPGVPPRHGNKVNVLQIWDCKQNGLAMLKGFPSGSPQSNLYQLLQNTDLSDDNRGMLSFKGDLDIRANMIFSARYYLPYGFSVAAYLPVVSLSLDTHYKDLTDPLGDLIKTELTNDFAKNVKELGNGLSIHGWKETGLGDLAILGWWQYNFPQEKPFLKNVRATVRGGPTFPTGKTTNPDHILSIPLGNDGAYGILIGGGLDCLLQRHFQLGLNVEFLQLFSNIRQRRIMTDKDQSDLLFLAKTCVLKDFGFTHWFNLYAELLNIYHGLSFRFTYQFFQHGDDHIAVVNSDYSNVVANKAKSLEEWTMHNFIYNLRYDFEQDYRFARFKPYIALFYKQPINGKNAIMAHTMGFTFAVSF